MPPSPPTPVQTTPQRPAPQSSFTSPKAFRAEVKNMPRKPSFGLDADPWASPDLHRGHNHGNGVETGTNGFAAPSQLPASSTWQTPDIANISQTPASLPQRTTSAFTTQSNPRDSTSSCDRAPTRPTVAGDSGWGGFTGTSTQSFGSSGLDNSGGYDGGNIQPGNNAPPGIGRTDSSAPRPVAPGVEETITITSISEKEGMMFFQHRNYEVVSARRNSKVIRRYSDFVWLLDCLHKRYPFRQLPLLPPKRVASELLPVPHLLAMYWKASELIANSKRQLPSRRRHLCRKTPKGSRPLRKRPCSSPRPQPRTAGYYVPHRTHRAIRLAQTSQSFRRRRIQG